MYESGVGATNKRFRLFYNFIDFFFRLTLQLDSKIIARIFLFSFLFVVHDCTEYATYVY